ncbi:MAG: hypothetical protein DWQ34_28250 [Planctomycetota bacterium]|nr:MAG: hypothetical protein DWQ34_28250 [Planctomycetota bacterium]REJ90129.1 MAG: hypothetical protein DWQ29_06920 [Planctomycetota bacterium]REK30725.1 MAG: hypothetical protein DWQ41_01895 [Planctomycetota bacterium]REK33100.1 MAG: hypothetical protein DWQ45_16000 [Planctomycetota bacterium]
MPTLNPASGGRPLVLLTLSLLMQTALAAEAAEKQDEVTYSAADTVAPPAADDQAGKERLRLLSWKPDEFSVRCEFRAGEEYDALLSFPSPLPSGESQNDLVTMEWYAVRDGGSENEAAATPIVNAPAILVIHESGSGMTAGRLFAKAIRNRGVHAFMIHLPYYGERRGEQRRPTAENFHAVMRQGMTDARRGRDAIAAIPEVDTDFIGIQGTSLGGFVTSITAAIDGCFDGVFIMLAGADLYDIVQTGQKDTAKLREQLAEAGYQGERLQKVLEIAEPSTLAHRLDPEKTWVYAAQQDEVVPIKNARLLAKAANLDPSHRLEVPGGHYTVAVYFPFIVDHMVKQVRSRIGDGSVESR